MNRTVNAEMVRRIMTERGLTPKALARQADISLRTTYRLLNVPMHAITGVVAERLAAALDCPVNLITRTRIPAQRNGIEGNT